MPTLWEAVLNCFNFLGDRSGCHQIPERCFTIKGYTFPICARCTGIFLSMPFALYHGWKKDISKYISILIVPMGLDWGLTKIGITKGTNLKRFITGFLGGFAIYRIQINIAKKIILKVITV